MNRPARGPRPRSAPLARVAVGPKIIGLVLVGVLVYLLPGWPLQFGLLGLAVVALAVSGVSGRRLPRLLLPLLFFAAVVFAVTALTADLGRAVVSTMRLATLVVAALAVSASTRSSALLETFDRALAPLSRVGLRPKRISLALALTVRFVPEIGVRYGEIREAQHARGLQNRPVAVLVPLIVRTFTDAEDIAAALDARCYDSDLPSEHLPDYPSGRPDRLREAH